MKILEGLVTTCDAEGRMHLAAMGPEADLAHGTIQRLVLKPFATSQTATNLARLGAGVFHAVDDALLEPTSLPASWPTSWPSSWQEAQIRHQLLYRDDSRDLQF